MLQAPDTVEGAPLRGGFEWCLCRGAVEWLRHAEPAGWTEPGIWSEPFSHSAQATPGGLPMSCTSVIVVEQGAMGSKRGSEQMVRWKWKIR